MSYVRDKIATFTPAKHNPYYWWRRFKPRQTLHPYQPLYDKIKNGDYEMSDYHYQVKYELELLEEKLEGITEPEKRHEMRGLSMERVRRLNVDLEKDEANIMKTLIKDFKVTFRVTEDELYSYMEECEGDLMCLYNTIKQDYIKKYPEKSNLV